MRGVRAGSAGIFVQASLVRRRLEWEAKSEIGRRGDGRGALNAGRETPVSTC